MGSFSRTEAVDSRVWRATSSYGRAFWRTHPNPSAVRWVHPECCCLHLRQRCALGCRAGFYPAGATVAAISKAPMRSLRLPDVAVSVGGLSRVRLEQPTERGSATVRTRIGMFGFDANFGSLRVFSHGLAVAFGASLRVARVWAEWMSGNRGSTCAIHLPVQVLCTPFRSSVSKWNSRRLPPPIVPQQPTQPLAADQLPHAQR